jgi:hypothetical protein
LSVGDSHGKLEAEEELEVSLNVVIRGFSYSNAVLILLSGYN